MKDVRLEVIRARMKKGASYTALFTLVHDNNITDLKGISGTRVRIEEIRWKRGGSNDYNYYIYIADQLEVAYSSELSEWKEE